MRMIAAGLVLLCSVLCVSAQETPVVGALNEKRVALTEPAVALDASGAPEGSHCARIERRVPYRTPGS